MAPGPGRKLSLPSSILKELDAQGPASYAKGKENSRHQPSRKDQRKAARVQKRQGQSAQLRRQHPTRTQPSQQTKVPSHKHPQRGETDQGADEDDADDDDDMGKDDDEGEGDRDSEEMDDELDLDSDLDEDEDASLPSGDEEPSRHQLSKKEQKKLSQDDKEIAALEKKLGLKGKKSLPKAFDEDGLGDLLGGLDDGDDDDDSPRTLAKRKRKDEADEWLAQKRRKAEAAAAKALPTGHTDGGDREDIPGSEDLSGLDDDNAGLENLDSFGDESDEDHDDDNFEGFSDTDKAEPARPPRENPYVAPTTGVAKYVPPSLRKQSGSDNEAEIQLRRRIQGLINRLTNDNMVGIVKDFTNLYNSNPRQTVTSTLSDLILALVCSPEKRPDAFFTMMAGFIAAAHKAMGTSVSAYLIQQLVEVFGKHYEAASGNQSDAASKNLISLLAELYNMQVVGCNLVFDYVLLFLENLSELNTELLLRIIQLCGPSLRRDDPHALRDIVGRIKPGNMKSMSVRTSFMIDEMKKLQGNKTKAVARNKDLAEQRTQIRKRIGTLGGTQDVQPLRVGLKDIQEADKRGKWWLVGASWTGNKGGKDEEDSGDLKKLDEVDEVDETITQVDDDLGIPDLWQLAREQGFNTEVRQRIFVALHAATDYENADLLIRKLRLNKHQRKEIPEVIVRSSERQSQYNHYYTLVASRFTGDRELGFQFRRCITTRFRKMGEDIDTGDGDDMDDVDEAADYDVRWLYNAAKMYGSLVAGKSIRLIDIIKHRNLAALQEKTHMFTEVMFIAILQECKGDALKDVFGGLDETVSRGVQYFLKKHVRKTDLLKGKKEKKTVKKSCDAVVEMLESVLAKASLE